MLNDQLDDVPELGDDMEAVLREYLAGEVKRVLGAVALCAYRHGAVTVRGDQVVTMAAVVSEGK